MGALGDVERKTEDDKKEARRRRRREATDEPAAHGGEQPFQENTQRGAGGNNPQVQGHISADNEGNVNLGGNNPDVQGQISAANDGVVNLLLQVTGGSVVHLGIQGGSNPQVKWFSCADGNINCGKRGGNVNLRTQYYDGTMPSPETELFGDGNINLGNQLYHGYFPMGPYGLYGGTITHLNGLDRVTVIRPYRRSEWEC